MPMTKLDCYEKIVGDRTGHYGAIALAAAAVLFSENSARDPATVTDASVIGALRWIAATATELADDLAAKRRA